MCDIFNIKIRHCPFRKSPIIPRRGGGSMVQSLYTRILSAYINVGRTCTIIVQNGRRSDVGGEVNGGAYRPEIVGSSFSRRKLSNVSIFYTNAHGDAFRIICSQTPGAAA